MTTIPAGDLARRTKPEGEKSSSVTYPLTWLRGLAALSVLTFHAYQHDRSGPKSTWPLSGAPHRAMLGTELFVDMFFVLSGFVLWLPVARAALEERDGRPGWVLLFRRMARLLPLYYAVVLLVWVWSNPTLPGHWQDLVLHLGFLHVYSDQYIFWTDGPAWSLAVEFHFYVLMALSVPLVRRAVRRVRSGRGRLAVVLALPTLLVVVGVGYLAWETVLAQPALDDWSVLFSPMSRAADFGIGTGLAVASAAGVRWPGRVRAVTSVFGVAGLAALVATRRFDLAGEWWHLMYAAAIGLAITGIVFHDGPWPRFVELRWLGWIGGLGYGIYLVHEPVMRVLGANGLLPAPSPGPTFLLTAVVVGVPSVALAWLSSRTIERVGVRLTGTIDRDGRAREYYPHVVGEAAGAGPSLARAR